jgi:transcriptional regulator with XRE-family HTH domain
MEPARPPLIGKNIQKARKEQGLTLEVLSERSGVSKAMLSQIEQEKANPTVATVWKISQGLNVDINSLLEGTGQAGRRFHVVRKDAIVKLETDEPGIHLRVLSPVSMVEDLEMYLLSFEPHASLDSGAHFPKTEEFLTVFEGRVRVTAGENVSDLEPGDFITYHGDVEHTIENLGDLCATVHLVVRFHRKR